MINNNRSFFHFLSYMVMVSAFLPIIFNNLPPGIRSHHIWAVLWLFSVIIFRPKIFTTKIVQLLLLLGIIISLANFGIFWINIEEQFMWMAIREFYEISVAITIFTYYRIENDYIGLARLARVTIYCIVVTAILSIITSFLNPYFARNIVGVAKLSDINKIEVLSFNKFGGGSYGFYSAIVCLIPILIYFHKNNDQSYWSRIYLSIFITIFFICLIRVQFFANILVASLFIILSIIGSKKLRLSIYILLIVFIIIYLIPIDYYIETLRYLSNFFNKNSEVHMKLNDFAFFISKGAKIGVSSEAGIRAERFPLLLKSFLSNPLFGGKYHNHHMFFMNKLAMFGIIGNIPFVFVIIYYIRSNLKYFNEVYTYYFLLSIFTIISLGFMKALFGRELWYTYFVILPALYYTNLLKLKKHSTLYSKTKNKSNINENRHFKSK